MTEYIRRRLEEGYAAPMGDYPGPYQAVQDVKVLLELLDATQAALRDRK